MTVATITTAVLVEAEVVALREEAHEWMLEDAVERIRFPEEHEESFLGAAETYAALASLRFEEVTGLPTPEAEAEVVFTEAAVKWMANMRSELQSSLPTMRGTIEVNENLPKRLFVLYILAGIFEES